MKSIDKIVELEDAVLMFADGELRRIEGIVNGKRVTYTIHGPTSPCILKRDVPSLSEFVTKRSGGD